jgi:hypothetical protein
MRVIKGLESEIKSLKLELLKLCWYMRGGISLEECYNLSYDDRALIVDIVKENMETTKKSGLPFF